jgi:hypothetical protein
MAEGHGVNDAMGIALMDQMAPAAQGTPALGAFGLEQVAFAGFGAQYLARGGDLKPFGHGFLGLNAFWSTHISLRIPSKERAL